MERLSDGDITKFDEVSEQPYISCLNLLAYWNDKDKYKQAIEHQNMIRQRNLNR